MDRRVQECTAVRQLRMGNLQLDPLPTDGGPVFAPVKLERFARLEYQRHECSAPCRLLYTVPVLAPRTCKSSYAGVGALITKLHQIRMHLLHPQRRSLRDLRV